MCALVAAERGHRVALFEESGRLGGQLNLAKQVPGKEEFHGLVAWFETMVGKAGIDLRLGAEAQAVDLRGYDDVVIATGVLPRDPGIPGQDAANVLNYADVLNGAPVGARVAVVGAGGIGFDVAEYLVHQGDSATLHPDLWRREWGVGDPAQTRGGLAAGGPRPEAPARDVVLLQRKAEKPGRRLGKTTGWIHRAGLQAKGVQMLGGVAYSRITPAGLEVTEGHVLRLIPADTVVLCAGQVPRRALADALTAAGIVHHVIGGADVAAELDAKRAIDQGARLAARL
jgi:2,4-dienoyl-CoA reductase (NADPH2)